MLIAPRHLFVFAVLILLAPVAHDAFGQTSLHPTPVEIAQLPRFCWGQLHIPDANGAEFTYLNCGPGANHYCSALIYMIRSRTQPTKSKRVGLLQQADNDVRYTERAIADYPSCSIRDHVAGTRAQLNELLGIHRVQPSMAH